MARVSRVQLLSRLVVILSTVWMLVVAGHAQTADRATSQSRFAESGGIRIAYTIEGQGDLVILLHGLDIEASSWRLLAADLCESWRVATVDLRGFGASDRPETPAAYAMNQLIADILAVISAEHRDSATLVGADWGAAIAWRFAIQHPDQTNALVVIGMPHPVAYAKDLARNPDQRAAWSTRLDSARSIPPASLHLAGNPLLGAADPAEDTKGLEINLPLLAIHGLDDSEVLTSAVDFTWGLVSADSGVLRVPNAGHTAHVDAARTVNAAIVNWLDLHRPG